MLVPVYYCDDCQKQVHQIDFRDGKVICAEPVDIPYCNNPKLQGQLYARDMHLHKNCRPEDHVLIQGTCGHVIARM